MKNILFSLLVVALPLNHCVAVEQQADTTIQTNASADNTHETNPTEEATRHVRTEHPALAHLRKHRLAYMALGAAGLTVATIAARQLMKTSPAAPGSQEETALVVHPLYARATHAAISHALREEDSLSRLADQRLMRGLLQRFYSAQQPQYQAPATILAVRNQAPAPAQVLMICDGSVDAPPAAPALRSSESAVEAAQAQTPHRIMSPTTPSTPTDVALAESEERRRTLATALEHRALLAAHGPRTVSHVDVTRTLATVFDSAAIPAVDATAEAAVVITLRAQLKTDLSRLEKRALLSNALREGQITFQTFQQLTKAA